MRSVCNLQVAASCMGNAFCLLPAVAGRLPARALPQLQWLKAVDRSWHLMQLASLDFNSLPVEQQT
jgi:hypothetical protein